MKKKIFFSPRPIIDDIRFDGAAQWQIRVVKKQRCKNCVNCVNCVNCDCNSTKKKKKNVESASYIYVIIKKKKKCFLNYHEQISFILS